MQFSGTASSITGACVSNWAANSWNGSLFGIFSICRNRRGKPESRRCFPLCGLQNKTTRLVRNPRPVRPLGSVRNQNEENAMLSAVYHKFDVMKLFSLSNLTLYVDHRIIGANFAIAWNKMAVLGGFISSTMKVLLVVSMRTIDRYCDTIRFSISLTSIQFRPNLSVRNQRRNLRPIPTRSCSI